jgi:hypothetical protein
MYIIPGCLDANISSTSLQARFSQVMSVAQASGEYEKVIQGKQFNLALLLSLL